MSIYGDAESMDTGLTGASGGAPASGSAGKSAVSAFTDAAGPVVAGLKAKAAADPQKAKIVAALFVVLCVGGFWLGIYDEEFSAISRCDDSCPDILFSAGLINGKNGTRDDGCGNTVVHDSAGLHAITLHGDTHVSEIGAHFDGGGECVCVTRPLPDEKLHPHPQPPSGANESSTPRGDLLPPAPAALPARSRPRSLS